MGMFFSTFFLIYESTKPTSLYKHFMNSNEAGDSFLKKNIIVFHHYYYYY